MRKSVVTCYTIFGRVCCVDCTDEARAHDPYIRAVPAFDPYYPPREGLYCAFCGTEIKPPRNPPPRRQPPRNPPPRRQPPRNPPPRDSRRRAPQIGD